MRTKVPHNVLTISELTKRPNRLNAEVIGVGDLLLTDDMIKKLRASSSMFNKSTYVQVLYDGIRYNVEGVDRLRSGQYRISLISTSALMTLTGALNSVVNLDKIDAI